MMTIAVVFLVVTSTVIAGVVLVLTMMHLRPGDATPSRLSAALTGVEEVEASLAVAAPVERDLISA